MTVSTGKVSSVAVPLQAASKKEILRQLKRFFISTNTAWTDRKGGGSTGEAKGRRRVEACVGESRADHPSGPQATDSGKAPQVKTTPGDGRLEGLLAERRLHPGFLIAENCVTDEITILEDRRGPPANAPVWPLMPHKYRPPICRSSDDVEDMLDRIDRLRRDGLFYATVMNLVTARAEWLFVKTGGRHLANGFRINTPPSAPQGGASQLTSVASLDGWGLPKGKSGRRKGAMARIDPQEVLGIPELHVVPEADRVLLPEAWCALLTVEYETLSSIHYQSPLSPHAEVYFVSQLAEIAMLRWTEPGAEKVRGPVIGEAWITSLQAAVDEAVLRIVWSLWRMYYTHPAEGKARDRHDLIIAKILATMGFACYRLGEFPLARECFKNAKILRISYNTRRHREPPMICPHVAAWGHNEALALSAL
ncbi:hypothetical protein FOZ62_010830, partial [Perkinsus olseni]